MANHLSRTLAAHNRTRRYSCAVKYGARWVWAEWNEHHSNYLVADDRGGWGCGATPDAAIRQCARPVSYRTLIDCYRARDPETTTLYEYFDGDNAAMAAWYAQHQPSA